MNENLVPALVRFIRSIAVLALPAKDQVQWLNSLGLGEAAVTDELAQEFDDGFLLLSQFVERGWIPDGAADKLRELDSLLAEISGSDNSKLWDISALRSADVWSNVRKYAVSILQDI